MDEMKNPVNGQTSAEGSSLLSESPTMSVDESRSTGTVAGLPVRLLRAAVAGLAISGIGYFALAASPELNKSFTKLTGLSVVNPLSAGGYESSCGSSGAACGTKCGMVPYTDESLIVATDTGVSDTGVGSCCSAGMTVATDSATACPNVAGSCGMAGVDECSGSCPFASAGGDVVAADSVPAEASTTAETQIDAAASEYVSAATGEE